MFSNCCFFFFLNGRWGIFLWLEAAEGFLLSILISVSSRKKAGMKDHPFFLLLIILGLLEEKSNQFGGILRLDAASGTCSFLVTPLQRWTFSLYPRASRRCGAHLYIQDPPNEGCPNLGS